MKAPGYPCEAPRLFDEMSLQFKSPEDFKSQFKEAALSVFGSGYAWLVSHGGRLKIITTANWFHLINWEAVEGRFLAALDL